MNEKRASSPPTLLDEPLIRGLTKSIRYAVQILAALIVLVIQKYQNTRCDPLSSCRHGLQKPIPNRPLDTDDW